jgi:dTMP kinase
MRNNLFITLEGIDGSGKTTAGYEIKNRLQAKGLKVFYTAEPTDEPLGVFIKDYILKNSGESNNLLYEYINNLDEISYKLICLFLFSSDRTAHLSSIKHKIKDYDIVICDRFIDSTFAYQSFEKTADKSKIKKAKEFIIKINDFILEINDIKIDRTYLLDLDPEAASKRISKKNEKSLFDVKSIDFFSKVRDNYKVLYKKYRNRIKLINASKTPDEIIFEILSDLDSFLNINF